MGVHQNSKLKNQIDDKKREKGQVVPFLSLRTDTDLLESYAQLDDVKDESDDDRMKVVNQRRSLVAYFVSNLGLNNLYAYKYVFAEFLNLFNVVGQVYLMNLALGGDFLRLTFELPYLFGRDYMQREDKFTTVYVSC